MKVFLALVAVCAVVSGANIKPHRRAPRFDGRIAGGHDAEITDLPYQVSLQRKTIPSWNCGGSIISENLILTAAHCIFQVPTDVLFIRAGSSLRDEGGSVHDVAQVIMNQQFDIWTVDFDYAILVLATPIPIGQPGYQVIKLADEEPSAGSSCIVSGWGKLSNDEDSPSPSQLQSATVPIVERDECNSSLGGTITERMLCAGVPEGGVDSCDGDIGSPLVCDGVQVGITSWGNGCARPELPGVYSSVPSGREWIREQSGV